MKVFLVALVFACVHCAGIPVRVNMSTVGVDPVTGGIWLLGRVPDGGTLVYYCKPKDGLEPVCKFTAVKRAYFVDGKIVEK